VSSALRLTETDARPETGIRSGFSGTCRNTQSICARGVSQRNAVHTRVEDNLDLPSALLDRRSIDGVRQLINSRGVNKNALCEVVLKHVAFDVNQGSATPRARPRQARVALRWRNAPRFRANCWANIVVALR
jgi:hypothetical protein